MMDYDEFRERVARMSDAQKERVKAKCQWESTSWLGVAVDWPALFDVDGMAPATSFVSTYPEA
jgi:hypothetical protein